ncbi:MAG: hypothetical protein ACOZAQ_02650 [Pseudomonadota bacterium]
MSMNDAKWWLGSAVVIAVLLFVLQHDFSRLRAPDIPFAGRVVVLPAPQCTPVGGPCMVSDPPRALVLEMAGDVRPLRPFDLRLRIPDEALKDAGAASVDFIMVGMDMGLNRYTLTRQSDGVFSAKVILPVCSIGRSDWMAKVSVVVGHEMWAADFPFTAESSSGHAR